MITIKGTCKIKYIGGSVYILLPSEAKDILLDKNVETEQECEVVKDSNGLYITVKGV